MSDASGLTTYSYDSRDRLTSKNSPHGTLNYTYDLTGNLLTARSSNAGGYSMDYTYDELNRVSTAKDNRLANGITGYSYDEVGNLAGYVYPSGVATGYNYDGLNRLTSLSSEKTGQFPLSSYAYSLGAAGNRLGVSELSGRVVSYVYDDLYRLTRESITADPQGRNGQVDYSFDRVGNRLSRSSTLPGVPGSSSAYDANDRLLSDTYDNNGNTVNSSGNQDTYDFENHLVNRNDGEIQVCYDGDGSRVSKTVGGVTTHYLVDTNNLTGYAQVVEELRSDAAHPTPALDVVYSYGLDLISQSRRDGTGAGWQTSFYGYDGHGSVRFLTDATGAVTDTYDYDAFGIVVTRTGTTPNNYLYCGEQWDADLGMYFLRARYLQPTTGRFWTMDDWEGNVANPTSLHRYLYTAGNPVNSVDPTGNLALATVVSTVQLMAIGALSGVLVNAIANYIQGQHPLEGAGTAALTGAAAVPLSVAFPAVGMVLAGLGIASSGVMVWNAFSSPDASAGQKAAATLLVGLSLFIGYGATANAVNNTLWINVKYPMTGNLFRTPTGKMSAAIESIRMRVSEFNRVFDGMPRQQQNGITMGVGVAEDSAGNLRVVIGTSEKGGYIRRPMRGLIRPDDIVVEGGSHAEVDIVSYVASRGWKLIAVGATRPICNSCAPIINQGGGIPATPLK